MIHWIVNLHKVMIKIIQVINLLYSSVDISSIGLRVELTVINDIPIQDSYN